MVNAEISWAARLNNSFSYLVSILGVGDLPSFRLSRSIEGVAGMPLTMLFGGFDMSLSCFVGNLDDSRESSTSNSPDCVHTRFSFRHRCES